MPALLDLFPSAALAFCGWAMLRLVSQLDVLEKRQRRTELLLVRVAERLGLALPGE